MAKHGHMKQEITHIGELAKNLLCNGSGNVIAVFENSWYLQTSTRSLNRNTLFCLGTNLLIDGPINVRTTCSQLPAIENGSLWHCQNNRLTIGDVISLHFESAITTGSKNSTVYWNLSDIDQKIIELLQAHSQKHEKQNSIDQQIDNRLQQGMQHLCVWLQTESVDPPDQLKNILGAGCGLTPTGDDILTGALITLKHTGRITKFNALSDLVKKHAPSLTNRISHAHLLAACDGKVVSVLHELLESIGTDDPVQVQQALHALDCYGHRSGQDALQGVLAVITTGAVSQELRTNIGE